MRICPECGSTKVQEDGEIVCTGCGLVLKDRDITTQRIQDNFNMSERSWENPKAPIVDYPHWVHEQRRLAKSLGLTNVGQYLSHFCTVCGKPSQKHSRLDLCLEHMEVWKKERRRLKMARYRARKKNKE